MKTVIYTVGIYCRLSREDLKNGKKDVSLSIENQQAILKAYVEEKGWSIYKIFVDDDVSGTTFDRPGFNEMMADIESGKINCVVTKDLSRFGRNRIESALHRERFLELDVRFIAIHDNYDGLDELSQSNSYDVATPIKEMMNEMYAAEVSRKVRSTKKLMASQGKFANSRAPYGYMKSKESRHVLVVDENVSHNVVRIFEMYLGGKTARAMALKRRLNKTVETKEFYKCGTYAQKGSNVCSAHTIDFDVLSEAVLQDIRRYAVLAAEDEKKLIDRILKSNDAFQNKNVARYEKTIRESKNRIREIDKLLQKLFEEKIGGGLDEGTFKRLSKSYTDEQTKLIYDSEQLEAELAECQGVQRDMSGLVKRVKECLTIDTLTRAIVVDLIDKIIVSEIYSVDGERNIDIDIVYKFGQILDEEKEPVEC